MDLDTLLRETAAVPEPPPAALAAGRARLDDEVLRTRPYRVARRRSRYGRRRIVLAVAMAAAASVTVVAAPTVYLTGDRPAASAEAAQVLLAAGRAAGEQPGGWPEAKYWHSVSEYRQGSGPVRRREIWIGHHDRGVLVDPGVEAGVIPLGVGSFAAGGRGLSWDELYALPTEPAALERELRAGIDGAGPDDDTELFVIVGDLLRESPAPPALRKALWEVAARVPGVRLVGATVDAAGRPGIAVERGDTRYVLDPADGRLLEEVSGPVPGQEWRGTYLEQGPADSAPAGG